MSIVMHIYHNNHAYIYSAIQNLEHAIRKLHQADREAYIAQTVRTCNEHTENGITADLLRLIGSPSEKESVRCIAQAISEVKQALSQIEAVSKEYQHREDTDPLGFQK